MREPHSAAAPGVIVVGAGIAGLTAAYRLARLRPDIGVRVIEAGHHLGGWIRSERRDGFLLEHGPDTFLARKPGGMALCHELGLDECLIPTLPQPQKAFIVRGGTLHPLPEGMSGLVPGRLGPLLASRLLSVRGRLRVGAEPFVPRWNAPGMDEETVAGFIRRRFGDEAYRWLFEPLLCGIVAGDGEVLSVAGVAPRLLELESRYGSVLRGVRRTRTAPDAGGPTGFVSFRDGMGTLPGTLEAAMPGVQVMRGRRVTAIRPLSDTGWEVAIEGSTSEAAAVVLAVPAWVAAPLVEAWQPSLSRALAGIDFASTATVSLGFSRLPADPALRGYGYLVPTAEPDGGPVLACSWSSSKLPGRAPADGFLLRVFLGRGETSGTDADLVSIARAEVGDRLGIDREPLLSVVSRHERAMPQFTLGYRERRETIDRLAAMVPGLALAGASYDGIGLPDGIRSGEGAARIVVEYLDLRRAA